MKKIFKSLIAAALALVVVTNGGGAVAKAAVPTCSLHESYYNEEAGANCYIYTHQVEVKYPIPNNFGQTDFISDLIGKREFKTCTVSCYDVCINVRCTKCNTIVGTYYHRPEGGEEKHSLCSKELK